ncbi:MULTISPECIES: hypothetical protein [Streptomyces]|uniref:hypothetical protein n=1 Tax=Streptomyces TaxID=1883 RepID=UPI00181C0384|nr:hypothetical protein [Streptomyces sp. B15]
MTREPNPADRRSKLVEVTEAGPGRRPRWRGSPTPRHRRSALAPGDLTALERILAGALRDRSAD